jgi:hypothetical protein
MKDSMVYSVAKEFSRFPGGRKRQNGQHSGEEFREDVVLPLLDRYEYVTFDLSGSAGYGSGFLDEAFGELGKIFGLRETRRRIKLIASDDEDALAISWSRIEDAAKEAGKN